MHENQFSDLYTQSVSVQLSFIFLGHSSHAFDPKKNYLCCYNLRCSSGEIAIWFCFRLGTKETAQIETCNIKTVLSSFGIA